VFDEMRQPPLVVVFERRTGVHDQPEFRAAAGLVIGFHEVLEAVGSVRVVIEVSNGIGAAASGGGPAVAPVSPGCGSFELVYWRTSSTSPIRKQIAPPSATRRRSMER
jgi:hypothetical protein